MELMKLKNYGDFKIYLSQMARVYPISHFLWSVFWVDALNSSLLMTQWHVNRTGIILGGHDIMVPILWKTVKRVRSVMSPQPHPTSCSFLKYPEPHLIPSSLSVILSGQLSPCPHYSYLKSVFALSFSFLGPAFKKVKMSRFITVNYIF